MKTARSTPFQEFQRLRAAGVNAQAAAVLSGYSGPWLTRRTLSPQQQRERKRLANARPKRCPRCPRKVRANHLSQHLRTHAREYGWVTGATSG